MKQIPNLFTLLNLVFGCLAVIFIFKYDPQNSAVANLSAIGIIMGSVFIFLSAVVDFLDGFVARLFKATSAMGAQLDSLADVVSFGVAPAMIMYKLLEIAYTKQSLDFSIAHLLPVLLIPCAGAWRLARFNLDKEQTYYFKGIPIPAAGIVVASLPLALSQESDWAGALLQPWVLYCIVVILSILMVSQIPMISLKFKSAAISDNMDKLILVIIAVVSAIFLQWAAVPVVFIAYVILSLIFKPNNKTT